MKVQLSLAIMQVKKVEPSILMLMLIVLILKVYLQVIMHLKKVERFILIIMLMENMELKFQM